MTGPGLRYTRAALRQQARVGVSSPTADEVIATLGLAPHPEGGFFRETFRARRHVQAPFGELSRAASTAIYFLLRAGDFSAFHAVLSDEVWHHYLGASLGAAHHRRRGLSMSASSWAQAY